MRFGLLLLVLVIVACAQSGYKTFYKQVVDVTTLPSVELLQPADAPQVLESDDIGRDIKILRSKHYVVIGHSSFNGGYEDVKNAVLQARRVGATVVLVGAEYTNTQTSTSTLLVPNTQTTYHSGSVYGGGSHGSYSGTSTSHGTTSVPITTSQRRYDQEAVFFAKAAQKIRYGVSLLDLTPEQRLQIERNTGAYIDFIFEETPAFDSNVLAGDILIAIDGRSVRNVEHALGLLRTVPPDAPSSTLTVIRKGVEKMVVVEF